VFKDENFMKFVEGKYKSLKRRQRYVEVKP